MSTDRMAETLMNRQNGGIQVSGDKMVEPQVRVNMSKNSTHAEISPRSNIQHPESRETEGRSTQSAEKTSKAEGEAGAEVQGKTDSRKKATFFST